MKRAMARQAEAEREKRAKIITAEGESLAAAALGDASDTMMAHPLALQLRNLQSLVEIGVDKNTTVVFPAPLMTHHRRTRRLPRPREGRHRADPSSHPIPVRCGAQRDPSELIPGGQLATTTSGVRCLYVGASFGDTVGFPAAEAERGLMSPMTVLAGMNDPATYLHVGWVSISVPNLIVIVVMFVLFVLAVVLPFPKDGKSAMTTETHPRWDEATDRMWTSRLRRAWLAKLPPDKLLPDRQPAYVASWIYVFGVAGHRRLPRDPGTGLVLAFAGPAWYPRRPWDI